MAYRTNESRSKPAPAPRLRRGASREHKSVLVAPSEAADKLRAMQAEGWECWHEATRDGKTELHFRRLRGS
jgi:hypothetical protein